MGGGLRARRAGAAGAPPSSSLSGSAVALRPRRGFDGAAGTAGTDVVSSSLWTSAVGFRPRRVDFIGAGSGAGAGSTAISSAGSGSLSSTAGAGVTLRVRRVGFAGAGGSTSMACSCSGSAVVLRERLPFPVSCSGTVSRTALLARVALFGATGVGSASTLSSTRIAASSGGTSPVSAPAPAPGSLCSTLIARPASANTLSLLR
ncbi:hypothetical protein B0H11DRAFT_2007692, partial [Mycena galericulata]